MQFPHCPEDQKAVGFAECSYQPLKADRFVTVTHPHILALHARHPYAIDVSNLSSNLDHTQKHPHTSHTHKHFLSKAIHGTYNNIIK